MTLPTGDHTSWAVQFAEERARLLAALRHVVDGGVIEQIIHVGATAIPGLWPAEPTITLAASVWPLPLDDAAMHQLAALGYGQVTEKAHPTRYHFRHESGAFQLYLWEVAADKWFDLLYTCDYLRHDEAVCRQNAGVPLYPMPPAELVAAARAWYCDHYGFGPLDTIVDALRAFPAPWYIASGWAIDLFLGRVTRCHYDADVVVARDDQLLLQQYLAERDWKFATYLKGIVSPWPLHMRLELPRHQVHAHKQEVMIDILFTDLAHGVWRYRRDPSIIQTVERITQTTADGIRFLAPELVLLFKSKNTGERLRPQDQADFANVYLHLTPVQRAWLRWALLATAPAHPWLALLT
jgi:hypothetical protein